MSTGVKTAAPPHHPALEAEARKRAADIQLRAADGITRFAGSMSFVYLHGVAFAIWCATGLFGKDPFPFQFLTMAVSLEAIFLSTFVMVGQNRQAKIAEVKADHDFVAQEQELHTNTDLTKAIHALATEIRAAIIADGKKACNCSGQLAQGSAVAG